MARTGVPKGKDVQKNKYLPVIGQFCDMLTELRLDDGFFALVPLGGVFAEQKPISGDYENLVDDSLEAYIDPRDVGVYRKTLGLDALRAAAKKGDSIVLQYRIKDGDGVRWLESRAVFPSKDEVLIATREAELRGVTTEQDAPGMARYDTALREIYDQIFEFDVQNDLFKVLYYREGKFAKPAGQGALSAFYERIREELLYPEDRETHSEFFDWKAVKEFFTHGGGDTRIREFRLRGTDGEFHWVSMTVFPAHLKDREAYYCFVMDIDAKKKSEQIEEQNRLLEEQRMDSERYRIIVDQTNTFVFEWNRATQEHYVSEKLKKKFPAVYEGKDVLRVFRKQLVHEEEMELFAGFVEKLRETGKNADVTVRLRGVGDEYKWCRVAITYLKDEEGVPLRIIGTVNDVDEAVRSKNSLLHRAEYDGLTGIYNTEAFYDKSQQMLKANPKKRFAIIRLDMNRFKLVNDLYGLEEGDKLLKHIAKVIKRSVAMKEATYGRLNGDVFGICLPYGRPEELVVLARRLWQGVEEYDIRGYKASPSFGICYVEDKDVPVSVMCDWANLALQTIKGNMIKRWAFYGDKLREQQLDERKIEGQMEEALRSRQFELYLQPKHVISTGKIVGAEALVRWRHPVEGLLPPSRFIPLFERNGFVTKMDEYMWEQACMVLRKWIDQGRQPVPISLNVSRVHAFNPGFEARLLKLIQRYGIPPDLMELELTESTFVEKQSDLFQNMKALQAGGMRISMDDFGSGYSSLNMLKSVPVNTIKLDREFLNETTATSRGKIIMEHTIAMVNELDLDVVAEGVETQSQADFLGRAGCNVAQGFHYSKPMPVREFEALVYGEQETIRKHG